MTTTIMTTKNSHKSQVAVVCLILSLVPVQIDSQAAPPPIQPEDVENYKDIPPCHACCAKGDMGYPGIVGHPGQPGPHGYDGLPGSDGQEGIQGPQGSRGLKGEHGNVGEKGVLGDIGPRGPGVGEKGEKGLEGAKGYIGLTGLQGPPGPIGSSASLGDIGQKGKKGSAEIPSRCFFSARRNNKNFGPTSNLIITYDTLYRNEGSDMNKDTGKFKAPSNGLYFLAATVYRTRETLIFEVYINVGNAKVALLSGGTINKDDSASATIVLNLLKDDEVYLSMKVGTIVRTTTDQEVLFCGYLIKT